MYIFSKDYCPFIIVIQSNDQLSMIQIYKNLSLFLGFLATLAVFWNVIIRPVETLQHFQRRNQGRRPEYMDNNVRKYRSEFKLSQSELASKAGLSADTIYHIERGERNPLLSTIKKISRALGISIDELFMR